MEPKNFLDAAASAGKYLLALPSLTKGENALKVLAPDTQFAVVGEFLQVEKGVKMVSLFDATSQNYFTGYVAVTPGKLQIYRDNQLLAEYALTDVKAVYGMTKDKVGMVGIWWGDDGLGISFDWRGLTLAVPDKTFMVRQVTPIMGVQFESKASGFNGGFDQLMKRIDTGGGYIVTVKKSSQVLFYLLFFGIIMAALAAVIFTKK
ncbi:MAG TPA: hypothetical protein VLF41_01165 [Candidatus Nanoarchaeia archaeon]|nr:hypothetical protein [Candidatus Nanoarchaeia archaeon]